MGGRLYCGKYCPPVCQQVTYCGILTFGLMLSDQVSLCASFSGEDTVHTVFGDLENLSQSWEWGNWSEELRWLPSALKDDERRLCGLWPGRLRVPGFPLPLQGEGKEETTQGRSGAFCSFWGLGRKGDNLAPPLLLLVLTTFLILSSRHSVAPFSDVSVPCALSQHPYVKSLTFCTLRILLTALGPT